MAALTRRTWAEILTEVLRRSGGINYSGWSDRCEQFISAAYMDICQLYRHIELEYPSIHTVETGKRGLNEAIASTNSDLLHIIAAYEIENLSTQNAVKALTRVDFSVLSGMFNNVTAGQPSQYAVYKQIGVGINVRFDRALDETRYYIFYYQRVPDRPDFDGSDSPEIHTIWDEHIIELALAKIGIANGDQQLAAVNAALFKDFVSQSAQTLVEAANSSSTPLANTATKMSTGKIP